MQRKPATTARTIRIEAAHLVWAKRAARSAKISVNQFFAEMVREKFDQRHKAGGAQQ